MTYAPAFPTAVRRSLTAGPAAVREARHFAAAHLRRAQADDDHIDDVVTVVSELATNAIKYGAAGTDPWLELRMWPRWTHVIVDDRDPAVRPRAVPDDQLPESGRGLLIVEALAFRFWWERRRLGKTANAVILRTGAALSPDELTRLKEPEASAESGRLVTSDDDLLRPNEVAELFGVRTPTIARWAREGRLTAMLTPGGHRRYRRDAIRGLLTQEPAAAEDVFAADAVRMYEEGWSLRQVADRFDVSYGVMRRVLARHTILRTRGRG